MLLYYQSPFVCHCSCFALTSGSIKLPLMPTLLTLFPCCHSHICFTPKIKAIPHVDESGNRRLKKHLSLKTWNGWWWPSQRAEQQLSKRPGWLSFERSAFRGWRTPLPTEQKHAHAAISHLCGVSFLTLLFWTHGEWYLRRARKGRLSRNLCLCPI